MTTTPPPRATTPGPRCAGCWWPLDHTLHTRDRAPTHPCCDPVHGRTVTEWADRLHNARVRALADEARTAIRYTRHPARPA